MKKDIRFLIARNKMLYGRQEADWDTEDYARFANDYLRNQGYDKVDIDYVDDYPQGDADEQAALREEIESAYRANRRSNDPTQKYAR
jgi:GH18 family chitinase